MVDAASEAGSEDGGVAIVLAGAGSRGAYEAGALSVLLPRLTGPDRPRFILGTSVGALNAAMLAAAIDKGVDAAADILVESWQKIRPEKVLRTPRRGALIELFRHFHPSPGTATGLVDTSPLKETIGELIKPPNFGHYVGSHGLEAVGIVASACSTMQAVVFVEGHPVPCPTPKIRYVKATLGAEHLMASSAFPMVFPPIWVADSTGTGDWYIDGGVHLNTPFKPAIDLGADRILVVGGTQMRSDIQASPKKYPGIGDSNGELLHALLTDGLEADLEHLRAINQYVKVLDGISATAVPDAKKDLPAHRMISHFTVSPSSSALDDTAAGLYPSGWLNLLRSFGDYKLLGPATAQRQRPGQFLSYLCFEKDFIKKAIELGKEDAQAALDARAATGDSDTVPWIRHPELDAPARD